MAPVERTFAHLVFQLDLFSREPEVRVIQRVILVPFFGSNFWFPAVIPEKGYCFVQTSQQSGN
jgi:hypothetical protein